MVARADTSPRHVWHKTGTQLRIATSKLLLNKELLLAERVGFEPTCRLPDKTLSRRPRYDHFGTSPFGSIAITRTFYYSA